MKKVAKTDFYYNSCRGAALSEKKWNILLRLITDVYFEYDIRNDTIQFNHNKINQSQIKFHKNFKDVILSSCSLVEEEKVKILEFLKIQDESVMEFQYINDNNRITWYLVRADVLCDEEGKPEFIIGCINNIDKKKREDEQLLLQSRTDQLTKLYNKEYMQVTISNYLKGEGVRGNHAFIIADIDNFRKVNKKLGQVFGDTILTNIADKLIKLFHPKDIVGRIGGDEFLILIKNMEDNTAFYNKINSISNLFLSTYAGENIGYKVSCSMGIAIYPKDGKDYFTLFEKADKALMETQHKQKNQYKFYEADNSVEICSDQKKYLEHYQVQEHQSYQYSDFDKKITAFAFDILSKTKDLNSAINMLLGKIGEYFNVKHVCVMEKSRNSDVLNVTYQWKSERDPCVFDEITEIHFSEFSKYKSLFQEQGIFQATNTNILKADFIGRDLFLQMGIKALLQCGIFDNNNLIGCVSIDECRYERIWTKNEIDSLLTVTKILSSYLIKLRTSEKIKARLEKIKNYDDLTGLPTLHHLKKMVKEILIKNPSKTYAVVYSDISNFKYINDTYGYETGDRILCDYANMIEKEYDKSEAMARISADNFVIVLKYTNEKHLVELVEGLNQRFGKYQKAKNINFNIIIASGASIIHSKEDIMLAIDNANIARKIAKGYSKTSCKFYDNEMSVKITKEVEISNTMEEALKKGEFKVYLQPKVQLESGKLVGAEALVRWIKKDGTIISPDEFIPTFEKNGFVITLDFFIYEQVCIMIRKWLDSDTEVVPVSVNVSRVHLNDESFINKIMTLVNQYHISPNLLELELTESIFLDNTKTALSTMHELRRLGFGVSIDDFGSGYSSLNILKDMETDVLKLDKEFFRQGEMKEEEKIIVGSIISMAKQLNMKVLSEGVETKMQSEFLKEMSCDMAQGYLYAKPMPVEEFEAMLHKKYSPLEEIIEDIKEIHT